LHEVCLLHNTNVVDVNRNGLDLLILSCYWHIKKKSKMANKVTEIAAQGLAVDKQIIFLEFQVSKNLC